jgi:AraC-like DNA-binding protein
MVDALKMLPAMALRMQLQGLAVLGLDMQRLHARVGALPEAADALVPVTAYMAMWDEAHKLYGMPGLPTALAMAIPFGAFGALDYLVGSADTIGGCCESALLHFPMVASDVWLECDTLEDEGRVLRAVGDSQVPTVALEFTIAAILHRLRYVSDGSFVPVRVGLPVPRPETDPVRERLYGVALVYDFPCAEIAIDAHTWRSPASRADPYLYATLERMAIQLQLQQPGDPPLEAALRARLRIALAQGRAEPGRMAASLGVSERTLQRRLAETGRSFTGVMDDFRRNESARLLCDRKLHLVEIAARLGYAEQTSFTRAFRRWTGTTPAAWRIEKSLAAS